MALRQGVLRRGWQLLRLRPEPEILEDAEALTPGNEIKIFIRGHLDQYSGEGGRTETIIVCGHRPKTKELLELLLFLSLYTIRFISSLKGI